MLTPAAAAAADAADAAGAADVAPAPAGLGSADTRVAVMGATLLVLARRRRDAAAAEPRRSPEPRVLSSPRSRSRLRSRRCSAEGSRLARRLARRASARLRALISSCAPTSAGSTQLARSLADTTGPVSLARRRLFLNGLDTALPPASHGSASTSSMVQRSAGFLASIRSISARAPSPIMSGKGGLPVEITRITSASEQPQNGKSPHNSTYSSTPMLQISTGLQQPATHHTVSHGKPTRTHTPNAPAVVPLLLQDFRGHLCTRSAV